MNRILIEFEKKDNTTDNFRFGMGKLLNCLKIVYLMRYVYEITEEDLNWCNVYIAVRPNSPMSLSIAKAITSSGRSYIVFFDDDLLNHKGSLKWRRNCSEACLELSDCIFGANPALCKDYGKFSKKHFSINTAVEETELSNPQITSSQIQIVYAAGKDHATIFEKIVKPALKLLIEEYGDKICFTFVGVKPRLEDVGSVSNFIFVPLMPLEKYTEYMRTHHFDIGLAPLENDRFSNMKYFNKYIEYSKSAIAGIYSDVEPYTYAVHNGENGYLTGNDYIEWYGRIKLCIDNINETRKIGRKAQEDLRANYTLKSISKEFEKNLKAVIKDGCPSDIRWSNNKAIEALFLFEDKIGKLVHQLHERGISDTLTFIHNRIYRG